MVTLTLHGELAPRGYADVHCNGQPFCKMYMDKHGNTRLSEPGNLDLGLWNVYAEFSPEAETHGDFPEETLNKARMDLERIFAIVSDYQWSPEPKAVDVSVIMELVVDGKVDQDFLDHLGQTMDQVVQAIQDEGILTPNDDDERTLSLENVNADKLDDLMAQVALTFSVDGEVDQDLLDHLSQTIEEMVQRFRQEGLMTPNDDDEPSVTLDCIRAEALTRTPLDPAGFYQREDDMNRGTLQVFPQEDGDICITVVDRERECMASVEFCTPFSGGGRSPATLKALRQLAMAMARDSQ